MGLKREVVSALADSVDVAADEIADSLKTLLDPYMIQRVAASAERFARRLLSVNTKPS